MMCFPYWWCTKHAQLIMRTWPITKNTSYNWSKKNLQLIEYLLTTLFFSFLFNLHLFSNYVVILCFSLILHCLSAGSLTRPTKEISIEFNIRLRYNCLYLLSHLSDHNEILHIPIQHSCLGMSKISLWLDQFAFNYSEDKINRIQNSDKSSFGGTDACALPWNANQIGGDHQRYPYCWRFLFMACLLFDSHWIKYVRKNRVAFLLVWYIFEGVPSFSHINHWYNPQFQLSVFIKHELFIDFSWTFLANTVKYLI